jgi:uncharacterized protein
MIKREATAAAKRLAKGFRVVAITGPRQSGKTTLAQQVFPSKPYVTLEDPDQRAAATADPRSFLARFEASGAILDEAQRCPELFSYLQGLVDQRQRVGDFVLTGSQQFGLMSNITQSLAGRVGLLQLLPLSLRELTAAGLAPTSLAQTLWRGGYPALFGAGAVLPADWLPNYVNTYIERDVRQLMAVRQLSLFQRFLMMCASRTGQLLNLTSIANDCGITHVTAREWLTVLEASYVVRLLPAHHAKFGKRLIKAPKLYFVDTALAAWLVGIRDANSLATHSMRGALFETWVVGEVFKRHFNAADTPNIWFWRDSTGHEVDLLMQVGSRLQPVEIKSGATFSTDWLGSAHRWAELAGAHSLPPIVVYGGDKSFDISGCRVVSWRDLGAAG